MSAESLVLERMPADTERLLAAAAFGSTVELIDVNDADSRFQSLLLPGNDRFNSLLTVPELEPGFDSLLLGEQKFNSLI